MMARSTNAPFKGRIQKRKTNHLQIFIFGLQRTAGPYKSARSRHHQDQEEAEATKLVAELDRDGPRHPTGPGPSCDITATQAEHGTPLATINFSSRKIAICSGLSGGLIATFGSPRHNP
jgi:hypothetical protein